VGLAGLALTSTAVASFPGTNGSIAFSSNRSRLSYDLYLMNADGKTTRRLTRTNTVNEGSPAWSADGKRIAFVRREWADPNHPGPFEIWTMRADGSHLRRLARGSDPAWAPSGRWIAYTGPWTPRSSKPDLWVMRDDGSRPHRLTFTPRASEREPDWSPNGRLIAYMSNVAGLKTGQSAIYTMRADGTRKTRLTPLGSRTRQPSWSPDGRQIAFKRWTSGIPVGAGALWTMRADGSNAQPLVVRQIGDCAWAPDGTKIAFDATVPSPLFDVYATGLDGAAPVALTSGKADNSGPAWQPLPRHPSSNAA
jgi:Tol biopolymer transport system component